MLALIMASDTSITLQLIQEEKVQLVIRGETILSIEQGARGLRNKPTRRLTLNSPPLILYSPALRVGAGKSGVRGGGWLPGDKPTGLLPMILLAGANAAIGTLWNCWDTAGGEFTEAFYHIIRREIVGASSDQGESFLTIDLALALREAVLKVREQWPEPYFWALFILHGNWTCRLRNRCMDAAHTVS